MTLILPRGTVSSTEGTPSKETYWPMISVLRDHHGWSRMYGSKRIQYMTSNSDAKSWDDRYRETDVKQMPWFTEKLDADLVRELGRRRITSGTFLDLCTGPGTQAIALSKMGFTVTATDISKTAIEKAKRVASSVEFRRNDILNFTLRRRFDYIFDRGCFHVFPPEQRPKYVHEVKRILKQNGILFLKCFSVCQKGNQGPYRFSKEEIHGIFGKDFVVESIRNTMFEGTLKPLPRALFVVLRKQPKRDA